MTTPTDPLATFARRAEMAFLVTELAPEMAANFGTVNEPVLHDYLRTHHGADGDQLADDFRAWWDERIKRGMIPMAGHRDGTDDSPGHGATP